MRFSRGASAWIGAPNFEGQWHLHAYRSEEEIATELGIDASEVQRRLAEARQILLAEAQCARLARTRREDPHVMERPGDRGHGGGGARARPA